MTKHRTITGFVTVALIAVAATAAHIRSHSSPNTHPIALTGITSFKELTADVNKLKTEEFDDQSLVYSAKR